MGSVQFVPVIIFLAFSFIITRRLALQSHLAASALPVTVRGAATRRGTRA